MRRAILTNSLVIFFYLFLSQPATARDFEIGQPVILQATKGVGVPLHRQPAPSYFKHVPSESSAIIRTLSQNHHWIFVELQSGETGWVIPKYLRAVSSPSPISSPPSIPTSSQDEERAVWTSHEQCQRVIHGGGRMAASSSNIRIATWNIRWFPNGFPKDQPSDADEPTDLQWLACTLAWMNIDILAVQESLSTAEAHEAWDTVTNALNMITSQSWRWYLQPCGKPDGHHVGFLWNTNRVSLSQFHMLWQFNVKATQSHDPCAGGLRPGLYALVQTVEKSGLDFHLIGLHLKSGPTVFAVEDRHNALNRIDEVVEPLLGQDRDVVILGDFNTMGAGDWKSQRYELKAVFRQVAKEKPGFEDLTLTPSCTHYFRGRAGRLDHVMVVQDMTEVRNGSGRVTGYCALAGCQRIPGDYPLAYRRLSDHCPVVVEFKNQDEDQEDH